jgi:diacylglycerol kinase family enzyme
MAKTKIIVNPYAGRWKAQAAIPDIRQACQALELDHELVVTDGPGHAVDLAREAVLAGFSPIVAAGGDGTISEVVNGLMQATPTGGVGPLVFGVVVGDCGQAGGCDSDYCYFGPGGVY